ncbi:unnamed protein product [Ambrosiozyma monospora]|uniref:Unnamed protein product n=1 Tax=Ambrosiozyma monospora TaxID=43982 RepID=A0ACB5T4Q0_AMBMO|nr:unnamed protein product [Ambrosiozyma monospora]
MDIKIDDDSLEGVTILRPLKGIDPEMELCLESSFQQYYPKNKMEILFCVQDANDPAVALAQHLINKYPKVDAKLLVDSDQSHKDNYGVNPKVNNLMKGYKSSKFDIIWVCDSNVWARPDTLRRSVYSLVHSLDDGRFTKRPVKLVHHAPLAISLSQHIMGAKLDEMFLSTSHCKFYVSLNKVAVAPCVNGKSNLYRKSDLNLAVARIGQSAIQPSLNGMSGDQIRDAKYYSLLDNHGLAFFARYIGEDNMIGIALWNHCGGRTGLTGDCVMQPLGGQNSWIDYCLRRMRWLRVRKYMVLAATMLEPSTECLLCGVFGTFAVSVLFLGCGFRKMWFCMHVLIWFLTDYFQVHYLFQSIRDTSNINSELLPYFLKASFKLDANIPKLSGKRLISLRRFVPMWIMREILALPIWIAAVVGSRVDWRGQPFKIKADLSAEAL